MFHSTECRTFYEGNFVSRKLIELEKFSYFHFDKVKYLRIVNHVNFVQKYYQVRYIHLSCEKNMLSCLRHRSVRCGNYQDSSVHLSGSRNHVLNIVCVAGTVDVRVVPVACFVLDVSGINCNTPFFFFRSLVNFVKRHDFRSGQFVENQCNCRSQRGFSVVYMTDCSDVNVRFGSFIFFLSHSIPPFIDLNFSCCKHNRIS